MRKREHLQLMTLEEHFTHRCAEMGLRACRVNGELCAFHHFGQRDTCYLQFNCLVTEEHREEILKVFRACYYAPPGCDIKVAKDVFALVEFPDGSIKEVEPEQVHFLDGRVG